MESPEKDFVKGSIEELKNEFSEESVKKKLKKKTWRKS